MWNNTSDERRRTPEATKEDTVCDLLPSPLVALIEFLRLSSDRLV